MWLCLAVPAWGHSLPGSELASLRAELQSKYGILAQDKTDEHSPAVLRDLLMLMDDVFCRTTLRNLGHFRYLFAYEGHDDHYDVAAYHWEASAISIGGKGTYPGAPDGPGQIQILSALAHEMGHAFLMERVSPAELEEISKAYGGWEPVFHGEPAAEDLFSAPFFALYPRAPAPSFASAYAAKNIHEWFAEGFSAYALNVLGGRGRLGKHWQSRLVFTPKLRGDYWADYNHVSVGFTRWLRAKLSGFTAG